VDGDPQQRGIVGALEPDDSGVGQLDLQLPIALVIEHRDRKEGGNWNTVGGGRLRPGSLRNDRGDRGGFTEAAPPGIKRDRADTETTAELRYTKIAVLLTLNLPTPPFAPRWAIHRRSESEHEFSPGDDKLGSGIEATMRAKAGSVGRLPDGCTGRSRIGLVGLVNPTSSLSEERIARCQPKPSSSSD
jgi:hypothetical protein